MTSETTTASRARDLDGIRSAVAVWCAGLDDVCWLRKEQTWRGP